MEIGGWLRCSGRQRRTWRVVLSEGGITTVDRTVRGTKLREFQSTAAFELSRDGPGDPAKIPTARILVHQLNRRSMYGALLLVRGWKLAVILPLSYGPPLRSSTMAQFAPESNPTTKSLWLFSDNTGSTRVQKPSSAVQLRRARLKMPAMLEEICQSLRSIQRAHALVD